MRSAHAVRRVMMMMLKQSVNGRNVALLLEKLQTDGRLTLPFRSRTSLSLDWIVSANVRLSPAILVPGLHLSIGQAEASGELHAVLHAKIFLSFETLLQTVQLLVGECRTSFARFLVRFQ